MVNSTCLVLTSRKEKTKVLVAQSSFPRIEESMACPRYHIDVQDGQDDSSIELVLRLEHKETATGMSILDHQHKAASLVRTPPSPQKSRRSKIPPEANHEADDRILNQTISITSNPTLQSEISFDYSPSEMMRSWESLRYDDENSFLQSPRGMQWMPSPASTNDNHARGIYRTTTPLALPDTIANCNSWSVFKSSPLCGQCRSFAAMTVENNDGDDK